MTPIYDAMVRSHGHNPAPDISDQELARIVVGTPTPILAMAAESYDRHAEQCPDCPPRVWDRPPPSCWRGIRLHATWASRQREVWLALSDRGWHR